ncbi:MAG: flagella basal body P-ring formation protein FlgA [Planctomycetota bacterium]|nr:MAG: flagella basal body P-ring formation protein FlgA [Planctomycetota bacterium]
MLRCVLLLLVALPLQALELQLRESVVVEKDQLSLADIAEIRGSDAEQVALVGRLPLRRLMDLGTYTIEPAEVRQLLRRHLRAQADTVQIRGSSQVRRASEEWSSEQLNELAVEHLRGRAEDRQIEVRVRRAATPQVFPADAQAVVEVQAEPLTDAWWGDVPYRLRLMRGGQEVARTLVVLEVSAWRKVPVTTRAIERGAVISLHDVILERVRMAPGAAVEGYGPEDVSGMVAQRFIPSGTPVSSHWARHRPAVRQGEVVLLVYDGGGFTLSLHVEALNDGAVGDRVRVRVQQGSAVDAVVAGPGEVHLAQAR